jgi:DNA-binding GntR family transcriptional regulator
MYAEEVVRQIENIIARGLEDDKLPGEIRLAEEIGCSVGTVQSALRELTDRGIVVRRHGYGTYVAGVDLPALDPGDSRPSDVQLADRIEKMIDDGMITGRFPPYRKFAQELGVGHELLNKSLAVLRERNVVYTLRRAGRDKSGTYVTKEKRTGDDTRA